MLSFIFIEITALETYNTDTFKMVVFFVFRKYFFEKYIQVMFFCFTFDDVHFLLLFLKGIFFIRFQNKTRLYRKKSVLEFLFSMLLLPILIISPPSPTKIKLAAGKFIIEKVHVFWLFFFIIQWIFFPQN